MSERLLRKQQVCDLIGLRPTSLYMLVRAGRFPQPIRLSPQTVRWSESEVSAWIRARKEERQTAPEREGSA
jgi:prophage regulatory protein